jgi:hypothetical protein
MEKRSTEIRNKMRQNGFLQLTMGGAVNLYRKQKVRELFQIPIPAHRVPPAERRTCNSLLGPNFNGLAPFAHPANYPIFATTFL